MKTRYFAALLVAGVALGGCGTDTILIEAPDMTDTSDRVQPVLAITSPTSGFLATTPTVTISGTVQAGSAPITELLINGEAAQLQGETFSHTLELRSGPNLIGVRANAEDRGRAVEAITVFGPRVYAPGALIHEAMKVHLGQDFLDNNTPELNNVAGILEALLKDQEFLEEFFGEPYEVSEDSELTVEHLLLSDVFIDLEARPGCIYTEINLGDRGQGGGVVELDLNATGTGALLGETIMLRASRVSVRGDICPDVLVDGLTFDILDAEVSFTDFALSTNEYPDLAEDQPALNDALRTIAESALAGWIGDSLSELLLTMVENLANTYVVGEDPEITAEFFLSDAQVHSTGMMLEYGARFTTPLGLSNLPEGMGSPRTIDPPLPMNFSEAPIAVALSDDAVNQLLFSTWYGGGVESFEFPEEGLDALPEIFQPISMMEIDLKVPPAFVLPIQEEEYAYDLAVGGLALQIRTTDGRLFDMELHFQAGVGVSMDEEGMLAMAIDNRAQRIEVHAAVRQAPESNDKGSVAALLRMMVPSILGGLNVSLPGFPIPAVELGELSENLARFEGRRLTLIPSDLRRGGEGGGYLIVEGAMEIVED